MNPDATVFVVDDDEAVRDSLRWLIESAGLNVETYASAQDFLDAYEPHRPGCLILDVRMPGTSGLELQKKLVAQDIHLPIIFLTAHGTVPMAARAMRAGAIDFIMKPFNDEAVLDRIEQAIGWDREARIEQARRAAVAARLACLTPRERQVMDRVVAGKPNKVIAAELKVGQKTIEAHRTKVMKKLHAASLADLMRMVLTQETT